MKKTQGATSNNKGHQQDMNGQDLQSMYPAVKIDCFQQNCFLKSIGSTQLLATNLVMLAIFMYNSHDSFVALQRCRHALLA